MEKKIKFCVVCGRKIPELSRRRSVCSDFCRRRKKSGYAPLYARDSRDPIIIFSLEHHIDIVNTNIKLGDYNLEILE